MKRFENMNNLHVSYNDSKYRTYVKNFFKTKFNIELIDTPDAFFLMPDGSYQTFINGKYNFDLIPSKPMKDLTFVEVETVRVKNGLFNPVIQNFNVLASKYWKYCQCKSRPGKIVYVEINNELNPTGKLAIIDSKDILTYCDITNYFVIPSNVNSSGRIAVYSIPKNRIIDFYDLNENEHINIDLSKISPIITVNKDTRLKYWNKFQNYSIDYLTLSKYNILRFQKYDTKFPYNEIKGSYEVNVNDIKHHVFKLNPTTNYVLISHNNIKKVSII